MREAGTIQDCKRLESDSKNRGSVDPARGFADKVTAGSLQLLSKYDRTMRVAVCMPLTTQ